MVIRIEAVEFSREAIEKTRAEGNLVRKLEEVFSRSIATGVMAILNQFFKTKYEVCTVRAKVHSLKQERTKAV